MYVCRAAAVALVGVFSSLSCVSAAPIKARDIAIPQVAGQATTIWSFPQHTWVENLAVRSNGQILATIFTSPQLYQVDPTGKTAASLVYTFPSSTSCLGIAELGTDIFYVACGNVDFTTFAGQTGSFNVWKVDVTGYSPGGKAAVVAKVANFPTATELNGITVLNSAQNLIAIADSSAGAVYSLNVKTAAISKIVTDTSMSPNAAVAPTGVNGIKVRGNSLFYTNTNRNTYTSIPIQSNGLASGTAQQLSTVTDPDDFVFDGKNNAYFAGNDTIRRGPAAGGSVSVFSTSTLLQGSTAAEFGRRSSDTGTLYVTTNGGIQQYITGQFTNPGKVVAVCT